jgi:hypothetical protein
MGSPRATPTSTETVGGSEDGHAVSASIAELQDDILDLYGNKGRKAVGSQSSRLKNETALYEFTLFLVRQILDPIRSVMYSHG